MHCCNKRRVFKESVDPNGKLVVLELNVQILPRASVENFLFVEV